MRSNSLLKQIVTLDLPAHAEEGEDSLSYCFLDEAGFMAVFDGCGGMGGRRYASFGGKTGALVAARYAARAAFRWFQSKQKLPQKVTQPQADAWAAELQALMAAQMESCRRFAQTEAKQAVGGTMVRDFPTTMSAAVLSYPPEGASAALLWAGDSRAYRLTPDGLCQLTDDDISGSYDAMENLYHDAPLTNVINAKTPFAIHARRVPVNRPQVLLTATDGFFSYFPSPMDFECFLLDTMAQSDSFAAWKTAMQERIAKIAGDDVTAILTVWGFDSYAAMKEAFGRRLDWLRREFVLPMEKTQDKDELAALTAFWQTYKPHYERWEET